MGVRPAFALLAALLAGCSAPQPAPGGSQTECGPVERLAAPFGDEGPNLTVVVSKRGDADATLCIRINEHNPIVHHAVDPPGTTLHPNVRVVAQGRFLEDRLEVTVWVAGEEARKVGETFALTEENFVEVELGGEPRLQVRKHDAPRAYA